MWNISIAEYHEDADAVAEERVCSDPDYYVAFQNFKEMADNGKPVYLWHDKAVTLSNSYFAIIESEEYKNEYKKIKTD